MAAHGTGIDWTAKALGVLQTLAVVAAFVGLGIAAGVALYAAGATGVLP